MCPQWVVSDEMSMPVSRWTVVKVERLVSKSCPVVGALVSILPAQVFTAFPTSPELRLSSAPYRVLLLKRIRLPLPLDSARCRCRARLDVYGDHRAACPRAGLLRPRGVPWSGQRPESAVRQVQPSPPTSYVVVGAHQDERRLEVIANGLPLRGGVQLAVDTSLVSALDSLGRPRTPHSCSKRSWGGPAHCTPSKGAHLPGAPPCAAGSLSWPSKSAVDGAQRPLSLSGSLLVAARGQLLRCSAAPVSQRVFGDGRPSLPSPPPKLSLRHCFPTRCTAQQTMTGHRPSSVSSSTRTASLTLPCQAASAHEECAKPAARIGLPCPGLGLRCTPWTFVCLGFGHCTGTALDKA